MLKNYQELQDWLNKNSGKEKIPYGNGNWSIGFENTKKLLSQLGNPELDARYRIITGGTAGKGTTARFIHEILMQKGFTVATFTSPDISCLTERFRFCDKLISEQDLVKYANELIVSLRGDILHMRNSDAAIHKQNKSQRFEEITSSLLDQPQGHVNYVNYAPTESPIRNSGEIKYLSFFEFMFGIFMLMCKDKNPDIINLEVGCGGEFDSTNAISGERISVLTFIGDDHADILGPSLKDIAKTKSKIFNQNTIAGFSYEEKFIEIIQKENPVKIKFLKNQGEKTNRLLAKEVCEFVLKKSMVQFTKLNQRKRNTNVETRQCLVSTQINKINLKLKINMPARWEIFKKDGKTIILDGAHSKPRIQEIIKKFRKIKGTKYLLLGIKEGRDGDFLQPLIKLADETCLTEFNRNGNKSIPVEMFLRNVSKQTNISTKETPSKNIGANKDPINAFYEILGKMQKGEILLVTGSFHLCGTIRDLFIPPEKILKQQTEFPN